MICRFTQDFCTKNVNLFRLSVETPTSKVLVYDLLAILEKQDAEQLQVFKAKCDKAVIAESKAVQEMEVKSLEAEKVRLEEKKAAKQNTSKKQKAMHLVSAAEKKYQKLMEKVAKIQETVEKVRNIASVTFKMPDFKFGAVTNAFGGPRFDMESIGGTKLAENLVSAAESYAARFAHRQLDAAKTKLQAELERRNKEWALENEIADAEVVEIEKQEIINEIKTQQVEKKHKSIENEILRSEQAYEVLSEKFTNNDLYIWLEKELGKVFKQYVKLLLDVAKMAERVYHFEIDGKITPVCDFIQNDYWDNFRKGLLAPERILLDLRRMEKAYLENDVHEMEITRPISLKELQEKADDYEIDDTLYVNPLNKIREDGACNFQLTEKFFENEFSNLSFLRIKDVQIHVKLTENASLNYLNAKLTLTAASIYGYSVLSSGSLSASMVASLVHQEPNNFTTPFSSEKLGVFEGYGTVSKWTLVLNGLKQEKETDDYPIDDVIVYLTYTAREGGENA